ncbi:unnamed protein product, partial [Rotaria sp. Silwood2]
MSSVHYDLNHFKRKNIGPPKATFVAELENRDPTDQSQTYTKTLTASESDMWTLRAEMT